jgi:1,4-alpha-glucan branching enzyme
VPESNPGSPKTPPADPFRERVAALLAARNADPFGLLGPHPVETPEERRWAIRFFQPRAVDAQLLLQGTPDPLPMRRVDSGFFEAVLPGTRELAPAPSSYRIRYVTEHDEEFECHDTYAFPFLLSEFDLYLMGEGRHYDAYEKLGAHVRTIDGIAGTHFAVWAPSARRVSVVGDFNRWDGRVSPMRHRGSSGIWELFIPGLGEGAVYKYEIAAPQGSVLPLKADPY